MQFIIRGSSIKFDIMRVNKSRLRQYQKEHTEQKVTKFMAEDLP